jgi:hypothetical protein
MKKRIIGLAVPIAVAAALFTAASALAEVGSYQPAQAGCLNNRIVVSSPLMDAVPVSYGPNVVVVGASHTQWVAYRAYFYRIESNQWFAGSWKIRQTSDDGFSSLLGTSWFDWNAQGWQDGSTTFSVPAPGTYRVYAYYYWYADQYVGSGLIGGYLPVEDYDHAQTDPSVCRF